VFADHGRNLFSEVAAASRRVVDIAIWKLRIRLGESVGA
jgi:hypothetical protein